MKYIDYREKLGIGFKNDQIFPALKNKLKIILGELCSEEEKHSYSFYDSPNFTKYFIDIAEFDGYEYRGFYGIKKSLEKSKSIQEFIFKCVVLINLDEKYWGDSGFLHIFKTFFYKALDDLNLPFEEVEDEDGVFLFPKGAKELDDALVSKPLEWLTAYPESREKFIAAIKKYSANEDPSEVADAFRKALERFFQEFFNSEKSIENLKSEYGKYLKEKGAPAEISNNLEKTLDLYNSFMNNYAKHHDKTSENVLEFIMYQTGNIIRLMISASK